MRILIVEDDDQLRASFTRTLQLDEHEVVAYASAEDAVPAIQAREDALDLVLCDLQLPGANGLSLLNRLSQAKSAVPFVLMTAHGELNVAIEALRLGATDFLTKPVGKKGLRDVIAKITSAQGVFPNGQPQFIEDAFSLTVPADRAAVLVALDRVYRHFGPTLGHLRQPSRLFQSALYHAAINALEHGSPHSHCTITIGATLNGDSFVMSVKDSGPGFDYPYYVKRASESDTLPIGGGKGIRLMLGAVSSVEWNVQPGGTTVVMRQDLGTEEVARSLS